jgi:hypothetical protein
LVVLDVLPANTAHSPNRSQSTAQAAPPLAISLAQVIFGGR